MSLRKLKQEIVEELKKEVYKIIEEALIEERKVDQDLIKLISDSDKKELAKGQLSDQLYEVLFEYYMDKALIPYEVAKARTGDPYEWILKKVTKDIGIEESMVEESLKNTLNKRDIQELKSGEISDDLFEILFNYYFEKGDMPADVRKDPNSDTSFDWIIAQAQEDVGVSNTQS